MKNKSKKVTTKKPLNKGDVINRFLDDLEQNERVNCKQAKEYISRFGFKEVEMYLQGRQDCIEMLIERWYAHPKNVL